MSELLAQADSAPLTMLAGDARPELHLSGAKLRQALETAITGCESLGGVERYIDALKLKSRLFVTTLIDSPIEALERDALIALCAFMPTVRRRIGHHTDHDGLARLRHALGLLIREHTDTRTTDARISAFCAQYPADRAHRWIRDLASEVLHNIGPERYPLMNRWVWDAQANTGALREMWFRDDIDRTTLNIADDYAMFVVLREELSVFLTDNGFFRDLVWYVDLLLAQIYAEYICAQGGTYLRADFSSPEDPMQHTRRMLGLDGVKAGTTRLRVPDADGKAFVIDPEAE